MTLAAAVGALAAAPARAATFVVNETDDSLSDGICDTSCTFRDALDEAAVSTTDDTIDVMADSDLSKTGIDDTNVNGDLDVCKTVSGKTITIQGNGRMLRWDPSVALTQRDRLLHVPDDPSSSCYPVDLVIEDLTLHGGDVWNQTDGGGGIAVRGADLELYNVTISECATGASVFHFLAHGGGAVQAHGPLWIEDSDLSDNQSQNANGGAVQAFDQVDIIDTMISGNSAVNSGASAGGLHLPDEDQHVTIQGSWIGENTAEGEGGGIWSAAARLALSQTEVAYNIADSGGGLYVITSTAQSTVPMLDRSALIANNAISEGGGLWIVSVDGSGTEIVNSTVSTNIAPTGAGFFLEGFGIAGYTVDLASVTVFANDDGSSPPDTYVVHTVGSGTLTYVGSLIDGLCTGVAPATNGYNVVRAHGAPQCSWGGSDRPHYPAVPFGIGTLTPYAFGVPRYHNNAGFSPSEDFIPTTSCPTTEDQRGNLRLVFFILCDAGSIEN